MNRILIIMLALFVLSCTDTSDNERVTRNNRRERHEEPTIPIIAPEPVAEATPIPEPEPEEPTGPETEWVEYFFINNGAGIKCDKVEEGSCGLSLSECSNGYHYYCLTNVKAESKEELVK